MTIRRLAAELAGEIQLASIRHRSHVIADRDVIDVASDFATACGVPDMHSTMQVEMIGQRGDVRGIDLHLVAGVGLARMSVPVAVMRDDTVALPEEEQHLPIPIIGGERPAVMEDDRLRVL